MGPNSYLEMLILVYIYIVTLEKIHSRILERWVLSSHKVPNHFLWGTWRRKWFFIDRALGRIFLNCIYLFCRRVYTSCACDMMDLCPHMSWCMWRPKVNFQELVLSFSCGSQGLPANHQTWRQAPFPMVPFHWPWEKILCTTGFGKGS